MRIVFEFPDISDIGKSDEELIKIAKTIKYGDRLASARVVQVICDDDRTIEVSKTPSPFCDDPDCESCNGIGADGHHY